MDNCPDDNDMACYFDGLLSDDEADRLEVHFVRCDRCKEVVEILKKIISQG